MKPSARRWVIALAIGGANLVIAVVSAYLFAALAWYLLLLAAD